MVLRKHVKKERKKKGKLLEEKNELVNLRTPSGSNGARHHTGELGGRGP